ncbi:MAG: LysM peptidoglycan-binding domain-containing protein [Bacteroidales bacterium]|nr:LysM peptidoglycan-binding domain-containing protein [Bacteroidales bacterium]
MDLVQILTLFKRNILMLIVVPILLAGFTYYFTRNQAKVYQSEAVIYTGITTGYSIESTTQRPTDFFSTSAQFDNMINLLKSRQTIIETSLRLLGQDLSLEHYNAQYISNQNYDRLQVYMPKRIKDLVIKNNKSGVEREKEEQIHSLEREINTLEKEINKKKNIAAQEKIRSNIPEDKETLMNSGVEKNNAPVEPDNSSDFKSHVVKAGETLFSIAKKYGLNITKLREINSITNRELVPGETLLIDEPLMNNNDDYSYDYAVKQVSPSLTSTTTTKQDEIKEDDQNYDYYYNNQMATLTVFEKDPIVPPGVDPIDYEKTVLNMTRYYTSSDTNFIYGLLHYGQNKHYSENSIAQIQIYRINNSDLVRLVYTSDDPGICQQTLKILSKVFMKNYKALRANETNLVVKYFERQVDSADKKLQAAEDRLLKFNKKNNIINYNEQSKFIAEQKEDLDLVYQNEQIKLSASSASLRELELNLTARDSIYLKSDEINQMKKELSEVTEQIIVNELAADYDDRITDKIESLRQRQLKLRNDLKLYVDQLFLYGHSTQGMPIKSLLDEWLQNTLNYVEARSALVVLAQRKLDFVRTYQKFAPLGAMLTRIEREIKVAEQSYLELLRSLNIAKMKQQNEEMATNIKIVDAPFFPIQANPSKSKVIVLASAIFGFLLVAFIILVLEYFDSSMKNPARVVKETKLKLAGAFPLLTSRGQARELVFINNRLIDIIIQNIKLFLNRQVPKPDQSPYLILVYSTQDKVGKTLLSQRIINRLREIGDKVLYLNYNDTDVDDEVLDFNYFYKYPINEDFIEIENLQQLISSRYLRKENLPYRYIILELPSLVLNSYPIKLIDQVDLALYVISASSKLNKADITAQETFSQLMKNPPMVILNEVELYNLDELLTDIPKRTKPDFYQKIRQIITYPLRYKIKISKEA